ncbi:MAG: hypothetical protein KDB80_12025 [Planctomycetes bacterium]|nr:hypothetical protein [Planctomycetota bacterium]
MSASSLEVHNVSLSFPFTFPGGGSPTTSIDFVTSGYLAPGGSHTPGVGNGLQFGDPAVTTSLTFPTIASHWGDSGQGTSTPGMGLYFHDNGVDQAYFEWRNIRLGTFPMTIWIELNADNSFAFVYGWDGYGINDGQTDIGFSPANGTPAPGRTDIAEIVGASACRHTYFWAQYGYDSWDLEGARFDFVPDGTGGYFVTRSQCFLAPYAKKFGPSCDFGTPPDPPFALRWTRTPTGFDVTTVPASFNTDLGARVPFADGDSIRNIDLGGATFELPNGIAYSTLDLDSNGRLIAPGSDVSRWNPYPGVINAYASIFPFWTDLEPDDDDTAYVCTDGATFCNITYLKTNEWQESNELTFQIQLDLVSGDSWTVVYEDIGNWIGVDNLAIGCSDGSTPAVAYDLTTGGPYSTGPTMFDGWNSGTAPHGLQDPGAPQTIDFGFAFAPTDGYQFTTFATSIPATATNVFAVLGTTAYSPPDYLRLNQVWPAFPDSCVLTHDANILSGAITSLGGILNGVWTPGDPTAYFYMNLMGGEPGLVGLPLKFQLLVVDPGAPWAGSALPIITTNAIETIIGPNN